MAKRDLLENALNKACRALVLMKNQAAIYGTANIPTYLQIQLEDKQKEVDKLEKELSELDNPVSNSVPSLTNLSPTIDAATSQLLKPIHDEILNCLLDGELVFFLGNDISQNDPSNLQSGLEKEMSEQLARKFGPLKKEPGLISFAQEISTLKGSGPLYSTLREMLTKNNDPTYLHQFLATLPATLKAKGCLSPYQLIVTSSYDDRLEKAFQKEQEPYDLVAYIAENDQRNKFWHWPPGDTRGQLVSTANLNVKLSTKTRTIDGRTTEGRTIILKIHGAAFGDDRLSTFFAITEDHYIDYIGRSGILDLVPITILKELHESHLLFLGYSLGDWHQRAILYRIWRDEKFDCLPNWAIQPRMLPMDKNLWVDRGATPLDTRLDWFISGLLERIQNLPGGETKA